MVQAYLASQYARREELKEYANHARYHGVNITARWLDEPHNPKSKLHDVTDDLLCEYGIKDLEDIERSDVVVFFSEPHDKQPPRGGRHVEFGFALAKYKRVILVGEQENIFSYLPMIEIVSSWDEALDKLISYRKIMSSDDMKRFWDKIKYNTLTNCWEWSDSITSGGYGRLRIDGSMKCAHRVSYETYKGLIKKGSVIDHLCKNRRCVNPDHLEAVTQQENLLRGNGNSSKTHCKWGHEFTKDNIYTHPNGRDCKKCRAIRMQRFKEKANK